MTPYHEVKETLSAYMALSKVDRILDSVSDQLSDPRYVRKQWSKCYNTRENPGDMIFAFYMHVTESERNEISLKLKDAGWLSHRVEYREHRTMPELAITLTCMPSL